MKEFYDILDKIKDNLRANPSVNTVTFGNLTDLDLDKTTMYPLAHIFVTNATHNGNTLDFEVNVLCMDIVDINKEEADGDDFYGNDNLHDVLNTQLSTLNSLISQLKRGSLYKDKYQLVGNPVLTPFKERFSNVLAGWEGSINISVKNDITIC